MKVLPSSLFRMLLMALMIGCGPRNEKKELTQDSAVHAAPVVEVNEIPAVILIDPNGGTLSAKTLPGNSILIFFGADCDHCQREATQIHDHLEGFKEYTLHFIAMDPFPVIEKFAKTYGINDQSNIRFMRADGASVTATLGYITTPTILVFDRHRKLVKRFDGETRVEDILNVL